MGAREKERRGWRRKKGKEGRGIRVRGGVAAGGNGRGKKPVEVELADGVEMIREVVVEEGTGRVFLGILGSLNVF